MTRVEVEAALKQAVKEIQEQSGRPFTNWSDELKPIGDLEGFDSLNAEEAAATLEPILAVALRQDFFLGEEPRRALPVREIVDKLCAAIGVQEGPEQ